MSSRNTAQSLSGLGISQGDYEVVKTEGFTTDDKMSQSHGVGGYLSGVSYPPLRARKRRRVDDKLLGLRHIRRRGFQPPQRG